MSAAGQERDRAQRALDALARRNATLVVAESCTAGRLAHRLSLGEGAARRLHGGFVVYTKTQKTVALAVPDEILRSHGAVSCAVAAAMAQGALARSPADVALAITGVAGPEPDEDGNPVGLVFIALARRRGAPRVVRHMFAGLDRDAVECAAIDAALALLEAALAAPLARSA
ncbi:MAG: CinA family protein [Methylobacteriaceae bacterium]|nr:CinA family protein [Methylobacteriaceae bacterium]